MVDRMTTSSDLPVADLPSASFDLPSVDEIKRAAEAGQRITTEDVSVISQVESELTGSGPVHGGPAGSSSRVLRRWFLNQVIAN
jgi:hypothetical protein